MKNTYFFYENMIQIILGGILDIMNKKIKHISMISALLILMIGFVSTASAADWRGTADQFLANLTDNITDNSIVTITESTAEVNSNYTIKASNITIQAEEGAKVIFEVKNSISINGYFLNIDSSNVTMNGITFKNIETQDPNGVLYWHGANGKLINCNFTGSERAMMYNYGAVCWNGANGTVINCRFTNNIGEFGGAIYWNGTNGNVSYCNFINNAVGGADGCGGAIYWNGANGNVFHCSFTNNTIGNYGSGGAIYWAYGTGNITYCTFEGNKAGDEGNGGAICWFGESANINNCTFTNNDIGNYGSGGAIYLYYGSGNIAGCEFINNTANYGGGAIYYCADNKGSIRNCTFKENNAYHGASIYWSGNYGTIENCIFTLNFGKYGGSIYCQGTNFNVSNCKFNQNTANYGGGAVYLEADNCIIHSCEFANNYIIVGFAGALEWSGNNCIIENCEFYNNTATSDMGNGGAIILNGFNAKVLNCNFTKNSATNSATGDGAGGAIYIDVKNGTIENCEFYDNSAYSDGGAIHCGGSNVKIIHCNFTNNHANDNGGAIHCRDIKNYTILECNFINNTASLGSAIVIMTHNTEYASNNVTLLNNRFINCISTGSIKANVINNNTQNLKVIGGEGALIYLTGENATINSKITVTILDNTTKIVSKGEKINLTAVIMADGTNNIIVGLPFNFTVNNKNYTGIVNNTNYISNYLADTAGLFTVSGYCSNAEDVLVKNGELNVIVGKIATNLTITSETINETTEIVKLKLVDVNGDSVDGNVKINVTSDGGYSYSGIVKGNGNFTLKDLANGHYTIVAHFDGTVNYNGSSNNSSFDITYTPEELYLTASNVTKYYKNSTQYNVKVTDKLGNPIANQTVVVTLSSPKWTNTPTYNIVSGKDGIATLDINLAAGDYSIKAVLGNCTIDNKITVLKIKFKLEASDISKFFNDKTPYTVKVTDYEHGNVIANEAVTISLRSSSWSKPATYKITTNGDGVATLPINLNPGSYSIKAAVDTTSKTNAITIIKVTYNMKADSFTKYFKNDTQYHVKVTDLNDVPVANATVSVSISSSSWKKAVTYKITTNDEGVATLNIGLAAGTYTMTASLGGNSVKSTVKVLPTLTASSITKKVSQSGSLKAKLVDGQGNPSAGKEVTFTVGYNTYTFTTDYEGIATLPIHLHVGTWSVLVACPETGASTHATVKVIQ